MSQKPAAEITRTGPGHAVSREEVLRKYAQEDSQLLANPEALRWLKETAFAGVKTEVNTWMSNNPGYKRQIRWYMVTSSAIMKQEQILIENVNRGGGCVVRVPFETLGEDELKEILSEDLGFSLYPGMGALHSRIVDNIAVSPSGKIVTLKETVWFSNGTGESHRWLCNPGVPLLWKIVKSGSPGYYTLVDRNVSQWLLAEDLNKFLVRAGLRTRDNEWTEDVMKRAAMRTLASYKGLERG